MNEKTTKPDTTNVGSATNLRLWKCTYTFVAPNGQLRNAAIIVEAKDILTAQKTANEKIANLGCAHGRLGSCKEY